MDGDPAPRGPYARHPAGGPRRPDLAGAPPEAVLFDFSGTLFDDTSVIRPERLAARCAARGRPLAPDRAAELCAAVLAVVDSPEGRRRRAGADLSPERHRAVWTELAASAPGADRLVAEAFHACVTAADGWRPYPDAPGVLTALRTAGVPVAVVSNTGWDIRGSFAAAGLADLVDAWVLSCELGVEKPAPEIFRTACAALGVPGERALMVGDDPVKDGGAVAAGLPVHLLPAERGPDRPRGLAAVLRLTGAGPPERRPLWTSPRTVG
ncbi:HAD family hydrolase [Streptomyces sp. JJ36]|nr:HAD family hydrolase [Streptomyces sp. JJ36]